MSNLDLLRLGEISLQDLTRNAAAISAGGESYAGKPHVVAWFLPKVDHALKGGVRTIFSVAEFFSKRHGTLNYFVIYSMGGDDFATGDLVRSLKNFFPALNFLLIKFRNGIDSLDDLPRSNAAFCSLWTTAFLLLKYNKTQKKYYFMQDFEPMFYEGGSIYSMIEQTYRFGFSCIANSHGVGKKYSAYSDDVTVFDPAVDTGIFYPSPDRDKREVKQVVFYGRPQNPRNGFMFGLEVLREVKKQLGEKVKIVSVGAAWDEGEWGVQGIIQNLGLLPTMDEVASLYRQSDVGVVFMATPHPSYQPLEYMASGCVVATTLNESNSWLLTPNNSLQVLPLLKIASQQIVSLLRDEAKIANLRLEGLKTVEGLNWNDAYEIIDQRITTVD